MQYHKQSRKATIYHFEIMRDELQKKVNNAIKLLRIYSDANNGEPLEIAYSGGKDSDVILQLAKEAKINYRAIYKNTTIDPPGTIKHAIEMGAEIIRPKTTFFKLIQQKGMPSRFTRFCCSVLKEYKILDVSVIGVRREESVKRAKRYVEPSFCRIYNKKEHVEQVLPILEWTLQDIAEFVEDRKLKLAPVYYDENGKIDYNRRLGCLGCPLASEKKRLEEFKKYPKLVKLWIRAQEVFRETHQDNKGVKLYGDVYENFYFELFKNKARKIPLNKNSIFPVDYKKEIEKIFDINL